MSRLPKDISAEENGLTQEQRDFLAWVAEERIRDDWAKLLKRDREREDSVQQKSYQRSL